MRLTLSGNKVGAQPYGSELLPESMPSHALLYVKKLEGYMQDAVAVSLRGRAPHGQQPLCNKARATIPQRRLFRREATVAAQSSETFFTLLMR